MYCTYCSKDIQLSTEHRVAIVKTGSARKQLTLHHWELAIVSQLSGTVKVLRNFPSVLEMEDGGDTTSEDSV